MQINEIFQEHGVKVIQDIKGNLVSAGKNATGETANSLRFEIKEEGTKYKFLLYGRPFFNVVQTGRRPTPDKKPSREMITRLTAWTQARGMNLSAVWAIATNIQKEGTKLWQSGGRKDIIDPAVDDFINNVSREILSNEAEEFKIKIKDMKWE